MIVNENLIVVSPFNQSHFELKSALQRQRAKLNIYLKFMHFCIFVSCLEIYCKWEPINLDRPDKSIEKKIHRDESSSRKAKDQDRHQEKKIHHSRQPSSERDIPPSSTPPKKPRLESQIKVQTPPPSSKLPDDHVSRILY